MASGVYLFSFLSLVLPRQSSLSILNAFSSSLSIWQNLLGRPCHPSRSAAEVSEKAVPERRDCPTGEQRRARLWWLRWSCQHLSRHVSVGFRCPPGCLWEVSPFLSSARTTRNVAAVLQPSGETQGWGEQCCHLPGWKLGLLLSPLRLGVAAWREPLSGDAQR